MEGGVLGGVVGGAPQVPRAETLRTSCFWHPGRSPLARRAPNVIVRHDFSVTALWQPDVVTDASGVAVVRLAYPETLTGWRATARASTAGNEFGTDVAEVKTRQDLTVRLQCPRFLVAGDTAVISALIQNSGQTDTAVTAELKAEGVQIQGAARAQGAVHVPAKGSARVDWQVVASEPGQRHLRGPGPRHPRFGRHGANHPRPRPRH